MKIFHTVRGVFILIAAILIAVFAHRILEVLRYFVGAVIVFYGLDELIRILLSRKKFVLHELLWGFFQILLGLVLLAFVGDGATGEITVCVSWACWSILREAEELREATEHYKRRSALPDILESLVVIVFSVLLLIQPTLEDALVHVYLLTAELITSVLFPLLNLNFGRLNRKKADLPDLREAETDSAISNDETQDVSEPSNDETNGQ